MIVELIRSIHFIIIVLIISSVFIPSPYFKRIILALLLLLLFQYLSGYQKCGLTELEYMVLGEKEYKNGYIYRIVKPVITIPEEYFNSYFYVVHVLLIIILAIQINKSGKNDNH